MTATTHPGLEHESYCLKRPGEEGPRIESYTGERTDSNGVVVARPRITRCIECGAQVVDG